MTTRMRDIDDALVRARIATTSHVLRILREVDLFRLRSLEGFGDPRSYLDLGPDPLLSYDAMVSPGSDRTGVSHLLPADPSSGYVAIERSGQRAAYLRVRLMVSMFLLIAGCSAVYAFYAVAADARVSTALFVAVTVAAGVRAGSTLRLVLQHFRQYVLWKLPCSEIDNY